MARLAAIAIDAADAAVVDRLAARGELPNLARMRATGASCRLRNVDTYTSESVWGQFLTGHEPAVSRRFGLIRFDPGSYDASERNAFSDRPFYAFGPRREAVVFDVPFTVIADGVEGAQVTAWGAHGPHYPRASAPRGLLREIDAEFGTHPAFDNDYDTGWYDETYIDNLTDALQLGLGRRPEIAARLLERVPDWSLFLTSISEAHSAAHHCWHGVDTTHPLHDAPTAAVAGRRLVEVLRGVDAAVGRLTASLPPDTVAVVFALHGMGPADDLLSLVLLPELLHRLRFGKPLMRDPDQAAWRAAGVPPLTPGSDQSWAVLDYLESRTPAGRRARMRSAARRLLGARLYDGARRLAGRPVSGPIWELREEPPPETTLTPAELRDARKPLDWQPPLWYRQHWPEMTAFALPSFDDGHVRINLRGRERDGLVEPADYRKACDEVIAALGACRDPRTGEPVVSDVIPVRADDPTDPDGPDADLVVKWALAADALEHADVGVVGPHPHLRTGRHTPHGFACFSGPGIPPGDLGERPALDLTRTVLELMGEPVPHDVMGRSLLAHLSDA